MNVWCTLVMLNDTYIKGAIVLAHSLRMVKTAHPIWCMTAGNLSTDGANFLSTVFDKVIPVPILHHSCIRMRTNKQTARYSAWIDKSFTKCNIFDPSLFPVDKVIFLDADMMFYVNCDELFDLDCPAATFSSPWASPYASKGGRNPFGILRHGTAVPKHKIRAGLNSSFVCIASMILVQPDSLSFAKILQLLRKKEPYGTPSCISGFDEQLLAELFLQSSGPVFHIHQRYNWIAGKTNWLHKDDKPRVIHYCGGKPWNENPLTSPWDDVRHWHKVYNYFNLHYTFCILNPTLTTSSSLPTETTPLPSTPDELSIQNKHS